MACILGMWLAMLKTARTRFVVQIIWVAYFDTQVVVHNSVQDMLSTGLGREQVVAGSIEGDMIVLEPDMMAVLDLDTMAVLELDTMAVLELDMMVAELDMTSAE